MILCIVSLLSRGREARVYLGRVSVERESNVVDETGRPDMSCERDQRVLLDPLDRLQRGRVDDLGIVDAYFRLGGQHPAEHALDGARVALTGDHRVAGRSKRADEHGGTATVVGR